MDEVKKRRKRRTKAEMEAARLASSDLQKAAEESMKDRLGLREEEDEGRSTSQVDIDAIVNSVISKLKLQPKTTPSAKSDESPAELVRAVMAEVNSSRQMFRTSSKPMDYSTIDAITPENYCVRGEADRVAASLGHELSSWVQAVDGVEDFWHARCMTCGAMATARWHKTPSGDKRQHQPGAAPKLPMFGGDACTLTESQALRADERARRQSFTRREKIAG